MKITLLGGAAALLLTGSLLETAPAQARERHADRPLTITRHYRAPAEGHGIEVRNNGNEVIAWGGFSANGFGYGRIGAANARREARNEAVRARTDGLYGYGFDGLGGTGFDEDRLSGFYNPFYGNAFNGYTGYNGIPTAFAFGPGFANRHITDSEDDENIPGPTPGELGYAPSKASFSPDD